MDVEENETDDENGTATAPSGASTSTSTSTSRIQGQSSPPSTPSKNFGVTIVFSYVTYNSLLYRLITKSFIFPSPLLHACFQNADTQGGSDHSGHDDAGTTPPAPASAPASAHALERADVFDIDNASGSDDDAARKPSSGSGAAAARGPANALAGASTSTRAGPSHTQGEAFPLV